LQFENFSINLVEKLKRIDIEINNEKIEQLYKYMNLLIEWNEKVNLTAIIEPDDIILNGWLCEITVLNL